MKDFEDSRHNRVYSELRTPEFEDLKKRQASGERIKFYQCGECKRLFEERSRHCPFCKRKTMGELIPIKGK